MATVLGPGTGGAVGLDLAARRAFLRTSSGTARILVLLDSDPVEPDAIAHFRALRDAMPALLHRAGLTGAHVEIAGDTAVASDAMEVTSADLWRVGIVACAAVIVLLAAMLGSLVMPPLLLAAELLILAATLGITTVVVQVFAGEPGLQHFVPFASSVLLLALGSDYGIYLVRRVWDLGEDGVRDGLERALPAAAAVIALAGIVLAGSFGLLALVPIDAFREFAIAMAIGVSLVVSVGTMLLVPSLIAVLGPRARWPAGRAGRARAGSEDDCGAGDRPAQGGTPPPSPAQARAQRPADLLSLAALGGVLAIVVLRVVRACRRGVSRSS